MVVVASTAAAKLGNEGLAEARRVVEETVYASHDERVARVVDLQGTATDTLGQNFR